MPLLEFGLASCTFFEFQLLLTQLSGKALFGGSNSWKNSWKRTNHSRNGAALSDRDSDPVRLWCPWADWQSILLANVLKLLHGELPCMKVRVGSRSNVCAGGWGAHRDAGDTRARVRRAVGSRAAPLCVLSLFRLQTGSTERSLGVLLLVFDSEFPTVPVQYYLYLGLPSKDSLNVFKFHRVWFHRNFRSLRTSSHVLLRSQRFTVGSTDCTCRDRTAVPL